MNAVTVNNVSFSYYDYNKSYLVLDDVNLQIKSGEFVCIIGHSGCGKTTLLKLLAGLLSPGKGEIYIEDKRVESPGTDRAVVFQNYSLFPWMTVRKNIMFGIKAGNKSLSKKKAEQIANEYLMKVGIIDCKDQYPYQLSGGMYQRAAIARALAMDADILLLDEPFGALDAKKRNELQQLLLEQLWDKKERCKTVVFVTHDIDEAILLADRIIFMRSGEIAECRDVPYPRPRNRDQVLRTENYENFKSGLLHLFYLSQESADEKFNKKI
jgi:NitT/TauT family transport system ATP-binding protein